MLLFTAGGFIYVADWLPELQKECKPWKSALQLLALVSAVGLMYLLTLIG